MVLSEERVERRRGEYLKERGKMASGEVADEASRNRNRRFNGKDQQQQEQQEQQQQEEMQQDERRPVVDYAESIEKVKDCGWLVE